MVGPLEFGYQGLPRDPETGLIYFRNRYYDPELGRFISADPKGYVDGPSMYAFEEDDPANGSDPLGFANMTSAPPLDPRLHPELYPNVQISYEAAMEAASTGAGFVPIVGNIHAGIQAATGHDVIAGHKIGTTERVITGAAIVLPPIAEALKVGKVVGKIISKVAGKAIENGVARLAKLFGREAAAAEKAAVESATEVSAKTAKGAARSGPHGLDPAHHNANVTVRDAQGNIIHHERVVSGNMTAEEHKLPFPQNTLASHTEARAVRNTPLQPGQSMTITGQRPPCPSCKGAMRKASENTGADVGYQWRQDGKTQKWTPPDHQ